MTTPLWQTNATNVARTNAVLKTIAEMFVDNPQVVSVITPLNEYAHLSHAWDVCMLIY